MKISLVADNPNSWIQPTVRRLKDLLAKEGHQVRLCPDAAKLRSGDLAFFLGCEKIVSAEVLSRNTHNLVVHESALPKGRGWSPLTWQILEGKNAVPISLFEAEAAVDSGAIYESDVMRFRGDELVEELRAEQSEKTIQLVMRFVRKYPRVRGRTQKGRASYYPRRRPSDSEVRPAQSLREIFNLLRVADNARYPVFFRMKGACYTLKIEKVGRLTGTQSYIQCSNFEHSKATQKTRKK